MYLWGDGPESTSEALTQRGHVKALLPHQMFALEPEVREHLVEG